jgi:hypothetical protein
MKKLYPLLSVLFLIVGWGQEIEWIQSYGGTGNEYGESGQQTLDGGFIVLGQTNSDSEEYNDILLIKIDIDGNQEWSKTFSFGSDEYGYSVQQTTDDGYVIVGNIWNEGTFLLKTDSDGNEVWTQIFDEDEYGKYFNSVQQTSDGGYIILGNSGSFSNLYMFLLKTNSEGQEEWVQYFSEGDNGLGIYFLNYSVKQTLDGGYILLTTKDTNGINTGGGYDVFLLKVDSEGIEQWSNTFGMDDNDEIGRSVLQTLDSGFIFTGSIDNSVWLVKTDEYGNELWSQSNYTENSSQGNYVYQTEDGGYILTGNDYSSSSTSDLLVIKTDINGNEEWSIIYGNGHSFGVQGNVGQSLTDGDYIVIGTEWFMFGDKDVVLVKISSDVSIVNIPIEPSVYSLNKPYPNPFNPSTTLEFSIPFSDNVNIRVLDIVGREVDIIMNQYLTDGNHTIEWNGQEHPSGIYFISFESGGFVQTRKVVLIK